MYIEFTKAVIARSATEGRWAAETRPYWCNVSPSVLLGFSKAGLDGDPNFNGTLLVYQGHTILIAETVDEFIRQLTLNNIRSGARDDRRETTTTSGSTESEG
jgi:hypothetical protein